MALTTTFTELFGVAHPIRAGAHGRGEAFGAGKKIFLPP